MTNITQADQQQAVFGGGCFWCTEATFDKLPGVLEVTSGYMGGEKTNPTYSEVSEGNTGHVEVVQVIFDPQKINYETLLEEYWHSIDPVDQGGQFCDRGSQYRTVIFTANEEQHKAAKLSMEETEKRLGKKVAVSIEPAKVFYAAEDYHQGFYKTNPGHYNGYKLACGRDQRLTEVWGKPPVKP